MASCVVFARMLLAYSVKNDLCFGVGIDARSELEPEDLLVVALVL